MYQNNIEERLKKHFEKEVPLSLKNRVMNEISANTYKSSKHSINKFELAFAIIGVLIILTAYTDDKIRLSNNPNTQQIYPSQMVSQQQMIAKLFEDDKFKLNIGEENNEYKQK